MVFAANETSMSSWLISHSGTFDDSGGLMPISEFLLCVRAFLLHILLSLQKKGTGLWAEQCSISRLTEGVIINQQSFISDIPCSSKHLLRLYLELLLGSKHLWLDASWSTRDPHVQNFIQYEIIYISLLRSLPIVISLYLTISGSPETSILGYLHFQKPPYPHSYLLVNSQRWKITMFMGKSTMNGPFNC